MKIKITSLRLIIFREKMNIVRLKINWVKLQEFSVIYKKTHMLSGIHYLLVWFSFCIIEEFNQVFLTPG